MFDQSPQYPVSLYPPRSGKAVFRIVLSLCLLFLLFLGVFLLGRSFFAPKKRVFNVIPLVVKKGDFIQDIIGRGNAESSDNVDIKSPAEGSTTIVTLLPEGSLVKKGEVLAQLDTQRLDNRILIHQNFMDNSPGEVDNLRLSILRSEYSLEEYLSGTLKKEWMGIENTLLKKQEDLRQSIEQIDYTKNLVQAGYTAQAQLDVDEVDIQKNKNSVKKSFLDQRVLLKYSSEKKITSIIMDIEVARVNMEETMKWISENEKVLKKLNEQLEACSIKAPNDGRLVYANQVLRPGRNESEIIKEGAKVNNGQLLFRLPNPDQMQIRALVPEANMFLIKQGMKVLITFDLLRFRQFEGEVIKVNTFPELDRHSPVKKYVVQIKINSPEQIRNAGIDLRTGISADIRIIVKEVPEVLIVPVNAIVKFAGKDFCLMFNNNKWDYREVLLGPTNDSDVVIRKGLVEGDIIVAGAKRYLSEVLLPDSSKPSLFEDLKKLEEEQKKEEEERLKKEAESNKNVNGGMPPGPPGSAMIPPPDGIQAPDENSGPPPERGANTTMANPSNDLPPNSDKGDASQVPEGSVRSDEKKKDLSEEDKLLDWYKIFKPARKYLSLTTIELCFKLDKDENNIVTREEIEQAAPELLVVFDDWDRNHNNVLEYVDIACGMYRARSDCRKIDLFTASREKVLAQKTQQKPSESGNIPSEKGGQQ